VTSCPGRKCDKDYTPFIAAHTKLVAPRYMTFGKTDPSTLDYSPNSR
jgi:hypothetical protein